MAKRPTKPVDEEREDDDFFPIDEDEKPTPRAHRQPDGNDEVAELKRRLAELEGKKQPRVPFPASLFGLPYHEYVEKEEWYQNVSWAITIAVAMSALALLIAIL